MSTAAKVAIEKREYPERFCGAPGCLWRVRSVRTLGVTPCGKHGMTYVLPLGGSNGVQTEAEGHSH